ncbi:hypothetical protein B0T21DRAFT_416439 [Apiosordaria backusii]|uniref:Uncharacterized protein n=1 Tax=Apiosordaria backusii TaxID=314023 RepID=A0AA39ZY47_9PEZI|nr:hypothetical protein B0T21DRAFT_416439 [Apiosordaria backusii]
MDPTLAKELLDLLSACEALRPACSDDANWWKDASIPMDKKALESMAWLFLGTRPDGTPAQFNEKFIESTKAAFDTFYTIFYQREPETVSYRDLCHEVWHEFARPYDNEAERKTFLTEFRRAGLSFGRGLPQADKEKSPVCEEYKLYFEHRKEFEKRHPNLCRQRLRMVIPLRMRVVECSTILDTDHGGRQIVEVLVEPEIESSAPETRARKRAKNQA